MNHPSQILFDNDALDLSYFYDQLQDIEAQQVKSITFLIAANYPASKDAINTFLKKMVVPVSGGIFPEIIYNGQYYADRMMAILWFDETEIQTFHDASNLNSALHQQQESIVKNTHYQSSFVFSNTKTRAAESALDAFYYRSGQNVQYAGAGAGDLADLEAPSIVSNQGLVADALQITYLPCKLRADVGHGWSVLSGPHLVTESEENRVKALDYHNIVTYYEDLIRNHVGEEAKDLSLGEMINMYPVGIQPYDEDMIVRDILSYSEDCMQFIGDIPVFSSIYILKAKRESLLKYVKDNADRFKQIGRDKPDMSFIFSCAGRRKYMAEKSEDELAILMDSLKESNQVLGVSSIGEIASNSTGLARLHSMSLVVANLWK